MKELRAHLVLNLTYWGGLTASEIAQLRVENLRVLSRQRELQIHTDAFRSPPLQPRHVAVLWQRYLAARHEVQRHVPASAPVIAGLRAGDAISSWAVWAILKDWEKSFGARLTPRTLRRDYLDNVGTEMSLHVLAYNLKRVMNILGIAKTLKSVSLMGA